VKPLMDKGLIKGGSLENALVVRGEQVLSKEALRFKDEFVRHKILDIVGDLALFGRPIRGTRHRDQAGPRTEYRNFAPRLQSSMRRRWPWCHRQ
jgi:UDP-3-O-[3-hydroxymyristoyl] N-acetylglucosamine deacetylase/3-hydroxyacyl-[acyl-carrier-protein] dehydratase